MIGVASTLLLAVIVCSHVNAAELEWFVQPLAHGSDAFESGTREISFNFLGGGATISWEKVEVDMTVGAKQLGCRNERLCRARPAGFVSVRYYPMRGRRR